MLFDDAAVVSGLSWLRPLCLSPFLVPVTEENTTRGPNCKETGNVDIATWYGS